MWMEKLSLGVLRVLTPLGPRYLNPSFLQRLYLLWIFRNFDTLPLKVLSLRQQRRIDAMCARHGFVSVLEPNGLMDTPLLGTLWDSVRQLRHPFDPIEVSPMQWRHLLRIFSCFLKRAWREPSARPTPIRVRTESRASSGTQNEAA